MHLPNGMTTELCIWKLNCMNKLVFLASCLLSLQAISADWGGKAAVIDNMYVYSNFIVVVQGDNYAGDAGECNNNNKWGFYWSNFDTELSQRVYSTLLAAYLSKTPIRPLFTSSVCGPEGNKEFNGNFIL